MKTIEEANAYFSNMECWKDVPGCVSDPTAIGGGIRK